MDNRDFKNRYGNVPEHRRNNGYFILGGLLLIALTVGVLLFANDRPNPSDIAPAAGDYTSTDNTTDVTPDAYGTGTTNDFGSGVNESP